MALLWRENVPRSIFGILKTERQAAGHGSRHAVGMPCVLYRQYCALAYRLAARGRRRPASTLKGRGGNLARLENVAKM